MLRVAVAIGNTSTPSAFQGFSGVIQRVQCYGERRGDARIAFVFSKHALPRGFCILGADLVDVNEAVRTASPVNPAHLGEADYLEYRPRS